MGPIINVNKLLKVMRMYFRIHASEDAHLCNLMFDKLRSL